MADAPNRGEMPFLEHLEELRWRLLKSLLAIAVGTGAGWFVVQRFDVIGLLKEPIAPLLPAGRLAFTSPAEPLLLTLKLAFAVGLVLASPIVVYQLWLFLAPALYEREKRLIVPAFTVGIGLFALGAVACYVWVLPAALEVLFSFTRDDLAPVITIDRYFGFAVPFIAAFGAVMELPLVITILAALGLVTPQFLARHRRWAIVLSALLAAFLTPPDALSMLMMLVPLLLLYEVSIFCAWVATRRRQRREQAGGTASRAAAVWLALSLAAAGGGGLAGQNPPLRPVPRPPPRPPQAERDTLPRGQRSDTGGLQRGQPLDTAAARKLGLPTGPSRSFPAADSVMDALLARGEYRITRYVADTLVVEGDSQAIFLRGEALVEREGTQLEADSVRYHEASCRLDARGDPHLFDQGTVLIGEGMRYDTCIKRGTVRDALTDFEQGGATWIMRGDLAVDSGSTRLFGAGAEVTSCDLPVPHYHFAARRVKWISKNVMVARPAVLYIRDVPILWLPFIFNDIRSGRRSGILVPRFGLNDLIRPSRGYRRHVSDFGYYWAVNDYVDLLASADWYAGRNITFRVNTKYRWIDRFVTGGLSYSRVSQLDADASSSHIIWNHNQSFDSRTRFNASVNYATSARVIPQNTVNPYYATARLTSSVNFDKRFGWGTLNVGGNRSQDLSNDQVTQTFPQVSLTPTAVNVGSWLTWTPRFSLTTTQTLRNAGGTLLAPGPGGTDSLELFFDNRTTNVSFGTPLRLGRWNWSNEIRVDDQTSTRRQEFLIPDSTVPGGVRRVLYGRTFSTEIDWQTGIGLPQLFSGSWKLQPSISILNTTSAGKFMIRNQFSNGEFVQQGKRLAFSLGVRPTFFGFFPGVGPLARIRHMIAPTVDYQYAPGARVPADYARALDPTGRTLNARSDPQQTITFGLSQNFEGKFRPPPGDTAETQARKVRLLSIQSSGISFNFEQAKQAGRTGWQTQSMTNTFSSELLPNFSLQITHDLWKGQVGTDTARFDPFLTNVSASFQMTPATIRGLAGLVGLGGLLGRGGKREAPPPPRADTGQGAPPGRGPGSPYEEAFRQGPGGPRDRGGFSLSLSYSGTRTRTAAAAGTPTGQGGLQMMNLAITFNPTANWRASWTTAYDLDTRQFGSHALSFERDLHNWRTSFQFLRTPNGNFAFNFYVTLVDLPDIKFDYDQQSFAR